MMIPLAVLLAQLQGVLSGWTYISPTGSYRVRLPWLVESSRQIVDETPDTNVQMLSISDELCREFIITERPGELGGDSLGAWVEQQVIPKLRGIGADVREHRVVSTREGPAVFVHYHHPRAASCTRPNDTTKADADVAVYIYHIAHHFYRLLYVMGERPDLHDTVLGVLRGPADTVLRRFAEWFVVSKWPVRPGRHPTFAALSLGNAFSCGLSTDSIPYCWGAAEDFALYTLAPTPLPAALKFVQLSAGEKFSCGVVATGEAYCWGLNIDGTLGIGSDAIRQWNPTPVSGGLKFSTVSVGTDHACGLTTAGAAYCWGENEHGELGTGDTVHRAVPAAVAGALHFKQLSVGLWFTCGLSADGAAYCWGDDEDDQLGTEATQRCTVFAVQQVCSTTPLAVTGGFTFSTLDAGSAFACGVRTDGTVRCWGDNEQYALGAGPGARKLARILTPLAVAGDLRYTTVGAGGGHVCALTTTGRVYCWGSNNDGQLGVRSPDASFVPIPVSGGLTFRTLAVGSDHNCGIATDGAAYCWGLNFNGALGSSALYRNGKLTLQRATPVKVDNPP